MLYQIQRIFLTKKLGKKNEEPKVPLKISEKVIERMISGAALWKECNSI